MTNAQRDVFYGRGWLLAHYLLMEDKRHGQLATYLAAMSNGASSIDAARQAFGDLGQLDKELNVYRTKPLLQFKIGGKSIHLQPISVSALTPGASEIILARARMKYGVKPDESELLLAQVRGVESRFQGDELVEATLAEAELNSGHSQAAEAAADRALKANPRNTEAMVLKGRAIAGRAEEAEDPNRHALFEQARQTLIAANRLDTEDPEPLYEFYRTFVREGVRPTDNALAALHYASDLAPQDLGVRMNSAIAYLNEGKPKEARATLTVVAYSPHVEQMGDTAKRMIADIDAGDPKAALNELGRAPTQGSSAH
jgi:Flp pilus assembly protein TadD